MNGFTTANSVYYLDTVNRLIWGGNIGNTPIKYEMSSSFIIGYPGLAYFVDEYDNPLYLPDGRRAQIRTGIITGYI